MKLNELPKLKSNIKSKKRVGRGIGSGKGKRAGKGQKGQKSRSGGVKGPQFEGGQMPIFRRLPALKGFKHYPKIEYAVVNLSQIEKLPASLDEIDAEILFQYKYIRKPNMKVKLLAKGSITRKVTLKVAAASAKAIELVAAAGGKVEVQA